MYAAYMIRFEQPNGRYWEHVIGKEPLDADRDFVDHRSNFIQELIAFNELKEARVLRKAMLDNSVPKNVSEGSTEKMDLAP